MHPLKAAALVALLLLLLILGTPHLPQLFQKIRRGSHNNAMHGAPMNNNLNLLAAGMTTKPSTALVLFIFLHNI